MSQRIQRVNQLLRQEISQLLLKEVNFENALVTVTEIKTSSDLKHARVKISVMPEEKSELVLKILQKNIFHIQQQLNKKLYMRPVPKICFEIDQTEVRAQKIEKILKGLKKP